MIHATSWEVCQSYGLELKIHGRRCIVNIWPVHFVIIAGFACALLVTA